MLHVGFLCQDLRARVQSFNATPIAVIDASTLIYRFIGLLKVGDPIGNTVGLAIEQYS